MATYDPQRTAVVVNGNQIIGYGGATFLKVERNEDGFTLTVGADGQTVRTKNANKSGTMEITLLNSSPANDTLQALADADEQAGAGTGAFLFKDLTGTARASAQSAWVKKKPALERGKDMGETTWILESGEVYPTLGGTTNP